MIFHTEKEIKALSLYQIKIQNIQELKLYVHFSHKASLFILLNWNLSQFQ